MCLDWKDAYTQRLASKDFLVQQSQCHDFSLHMLEKGLTLSSSLVLAAICLHPIAHVFDFFIYFSFFLYFFMTLL